MRKFKLLIVTFILLLSINVNAQWVQKSDGMGSNKGIYGLATLGNYVFAATGAYGVYVSSNYGEDGWDFTSLDGTINCISVNGTNIFAGKDNYPLGSGGVYISQNTGITWTQTALTNKAVRALAFSGNNIYAGTWEDGVYLSTNNGASWTPAGLTTQTVISLTTLGNYIFAGTYDYNSPKGIYVSTNNGTSWTQTSLNNKNVNALTTLGTNVFAGTYSSNPSGVYISTNNGTSWTITALNNKLVNTITVSGNNLFAGVYNDGVYLSTNNGTNWINKNQGFYTVPSVHSILITNNYIFAGTYAYSVWRRDLAEILTGIQNISTEIPSDYSLKQNYPNPFNPATTISFSLPSKSFVSLKVFDALGREVSILLADELPAGTYARQWNAATLPSGVYFYRLQAGSFTETKRLVLLK